MHQKMMQAQWNSKSMNFIKVNSGFDLPTVLRATPSPCNKCACMVHSSGFLQSSYGFFSHLILAVVIDHFGPQSTQSPLWRKTVCGWRRKTHDMVVPLINVISSIRDHQKLFRFHIGFPVLPVCAAVCDAHHRISNNSLHIYKAHSWW